jgi:predicted nucleic acid-binding protein
VKVVFDTSALVAAMVEGHPLHERSLPWLEKARRGALEYVVAAHSVAEVYTVLSSYPTRPRLTPGLAARLVHDNVAAVAHVVPLTATDYASVVRGVAELGLSGGVVYDALVAQAARKTNADRLLTLNPRDFLRVWPEGADVVFAP